MNKPAGRGFPASDRRSDPTNGGSVEKLVVAVDYVVGFDAHREAATEKDFARYRLGARSEFKENEVSELDHVLHAQISKPAAVGLGARVDALIESHRRQALHSTTSTSECIGELVRRNEGLEQAVRALALAVEDLATPGR